MPPPGAGGQPGLREDVAQDIPSFKVRRGRTGPTSLEAMARLWPRYGLGLADVQDLAVVHPFVVEIGFGMGESTAQMAAAAPDEQVLAIEVHPAGVCALVRRLECGEQTNVRIVQADAVPVLQVLPDASIDELRLFFPDPWPKTRHAKRRLLKPSFAALLSTKLAPGGRLHLATDWPGYIEHARAALVGWDLVQTPRPPGRPVTGYERRALRQGRPVADLIARPGGGQVRA